MLNIHFFATPKRFFAISQTLMPWLLGIAFLTLTGGYVAAFNAPLDYQHGVLGLFLYLHVPLAWFALFCYAAQAACFGSFLIWKHPLAALAGQAMLPIGAVLAALCLITGMLWGKPAWGAWWVWDARLTSMLVLFFLFLGLQAMLRLITPLAKAVHSTAIISLVGVVNLPIIKFSVEWWNTLHQPASITFTKSAIAAPMLWPLLVVSLGWWCFIVWLWLVRTQMLFWQRKNEAL